MTILAPRALLAPRGPAQHPHPPPAPPFRAAPPLATALPLKLNRLISNTPRLAERLEVHDLNSIGARLYERHFGKPRVANRETIAAIIAEAAAGQKFSRNFLLSEWDELVDAWQLASWEAYRDVQRLGRKTRLSEAQRAAAWSVFAAVRRRAGLR